MKKIIVCTVMVLVLDILPTTGPLAEIGADVVWDDDFRQPRRYEIRGERQWEIDTDEGRCGFRGVRDSRLIAPLPNLSEATLRTELVVTKREGDGFVWCGLTLDQDSQNHWLLALVESPKGTRYLELLERLNGIHQAQMGGASLLRSERKASFENWEYGKRYRLEIALKPESITGTVTDTATGSRWRNTYFFAHSDALRRGRPGLANSGCAGTFFSLRAEAPPRGPTGTQIDLKGGEAGSIAILQDEANEAAPKLAAAFQQRGYGVTLIGWDNLREAALPYDALDLFVLADGRRVPACGRDALISLLQRGGKAIVIGAPALSDLRFRSDDGWVGAEEFRRVMIEKLDKKHIEIPVDSWRKVAKYPEKYWVVERDPDAGPRAWKFSVDHEGWNGFRAPFENAFGEDRKVLTFWAKGDEKTEQLAIELTEKDGSRWIATIDLTTEWKLYALWPSHFPNWPDSKANRGASGDEVISRNVLAVTFTIAQSHTPKNEAGRHTFYVRDIATASDPGMGQLDLNVPDIEALCPSYKLFPVNNIAVLRSAREQGVLPTQLEIKFAGDAYSPVWRERGRGFARFRSWRWIPLLEAIDRNGGRHGTPLSLMVGEHVLPDALWANVAVSDPDKAAEGRLLEAIVKTADAMIRGTFLLEGGAELFSYKVGETIRFGALAANVGGKERTLTVEISAADSSGRVVWRRSEDRSLEPRTRCEMSWEWKPRRLDSKGYQIKTVLREGGAIRDVIRHSIEALPTEPAKPDEFVRVEGSNFVLNGKPWYLKGVNYRPTYVAGYPHLNLVQRECYDPEIIERDLSWCESVGVNCLSAIHNLIPPNPDRRHAYRDQLDFLNRCRNHNIKVFFFLSHGRPFGGADVEKIKQYIEAAGIKDHPAVMCWELAWEPIEGPWQGGLDYIRELWNRWVVERYGSIETATKDWGFSPKTSDDGKLPVPTVEQCRAQGEWNCMVAAFRRAHSDILSREYRAIISELRAWDTKHLISFRFGACGIPTGLRFAHGHSVGVGKHVDFLNPEGYNLQTNGWAKPTPPDDLRKGGLVTLYFRFMSREKPVVWMEFGYTVNGFHAKWRPEMVHLKSEELARQKAEYESFYSMFIESGARGAAPWWLPGGFRRGENSDFGILNPDGVERPVVEVLRRYLPKFDTVEHETPTAYIDLDLDAHTADAWQVYAPQYLKLIKAGETPYLRTAGTGTNSATCPLTAVGGTKYNGHNPPQFLNAELNSLELRSGEGVWRPVETGDKIRVKQGEPVYCRASVGNIAEAAWLAPRDGLAKGGVFLAGREEYGLKFKAPIVADTPFLKDAEVRAFTLLDAADGDSTVSFEMTAEGRAYFGERRTVTLTAK